MLKANSGGENARADPDEAKQALVSELEARSEPDHPIYPITRDLADEAGLSLKQAGYHIRDAAKLAGVEIEKWSNHSPARWQINPTGGQP